MKYFRRSRRTAAALVVTLSLIVIITVLVLAFFANSRMNQQLENSSTDRIDTDLLARSVLELIVSDLKQEMLGGSMDTNGTGSTLRPLSGATMVAERILADPAMGTNVLFDALLKQSVQNRPMFTGSANSAAPKIAGASSISTTTPARNNRRIGIQRWNAPMLVREEFQASQAPHWVYLGTEGISNVTSSNVVGRFAFNVYSVGGLLNINVAGYPASLSAAQKLAIKGTPAGATLGGFIPGILDPEKLVEWRNAQSGLNSNAFVDSILNATNGFREPASGDNRFVSRQDLIRFVRQHPDVLLTNALPYLTTFSLERNAPSWGPMTNAPSAGFAYLDNSTNAASTNRLFTMAKYPAEASIVPYGLNGSALPAYTVKAGDPVARQRFPLDRLKWIGADGPANGASAAAIRAAFGLEWSVPDKAWRYDPNLLVSGSRLATLNDVAASGREPNFFELLKAVILNGSLGKDANEGISANRTFEQNPDFQIVQIGGNIIDQYRGDDLPTRIKFAASPVLFSGVVDLPYLNKVYNIFYRPPQGAAVGSGNQTVDRWHLGAWLVPEFWRPHVRSIFSATAGNNNVRFVPDGTMTFTIQNSLSATYVNQNLTGASLTIAAAGDAFRDHPDFVRGGATIGGPNAAAGTISDPGGFGSLSGVNVGFYNSSDYGVLNSGFDQGVELPPGSREYSVRNLSVRDVHLAPAAGTKVNFSLEVQLADGSWVGYDAIKNYQNHTSVVLGLRRAEGSTENPDLVNTYQMPREPNNVMIMLLRGYFFYNHYWTGEALQYPIPLSAVARVDPRTDRFGLSAFLAAQPGWLRAAKKNLADVVYYDTTRWPVDAQDGTYQTELGGQKSIQLSLPSGGQFTGSGWANNSIGSAVSIPARGPAVGNYPGALADNKPGALNYTDNDGVQRRALGAYSSYFMNQSDRTPVMLNRRFFTVGDLGYVHRGEPWKHLDFFTAQSGDAGLLDAFTTSDLGLITEGKIDLNSAPAAVLQAYLAGTVMNEASSTGTFIGTGSVASIADDIRNEVRARPMINKSELVTRFDDASALRTALELDKARHETYVRGLADIVQTRTWNLMIDVIVQKGEIARNSSDLKDFLVEGERRYWLHIAIDRFTGEILDRRLEAVYE